jgi:4-diphosphocytidyl-2-C-methyl-D-erythritol kinase
MIRTSLADEVRLTLRETPGVVLTCSDPGVPTDERNLAVRAALLWFRETQAPGGVAIDLQKRIPAGGGLGGASSDAAAVLNGLARLTSGALRDPALVAMAAQLGSDVPFFLGSATARCTGRGEILTPVDLADLPHRALLVTPRFGVATPWAYGAYASAPSGLRRGKGVGTFGGGDMRNDLEPVVFRKYPLLAELRSWLASRPGATSAMMSGSGATVFALLDDTAEPETWRTDLEMRLGRPALFEVVTLG